MVTIVVYFESLHNFAATSSSQAQQDAASLNYTTIGELRLRYEQGLDLLLNAADLEVPCSAIFMERADLNATILQECLGESLIKKFRQLELYEIPTFVLAPSNVATELDTNVATALDTNVATTLDTNVATALDTSVATELNTNVATALDTNVATALDTNVATELDTSVATELDTSVASSLQSKSATSAILDFAKVITANEYRELELIEAAQNFTV